MSERKMASIQLIADLSPIEGADNILRARVLGWDVVVKKDEFKIGDPCVFFEIDSLLPDGPEWSEFMRRRKFRVKTMKLRGVLSQGLALPKAILGDNVYVAQPIKYLPTNDGGLVEAGHITGMKVDGIEQRIIRIGDDVSELLDVKKWEPVLPDSKEIAGRFPIDVPKTDEIRIQSAPTVLEEIAGRDFYVTTKLDGMSATFVKTLDGPLIVCSRNWALKPGNNVWWQMAERYRLEQILPPGIAVQGEICGPSIQSNRLRLLAPELFVFNVYSIPAKAYLSFEQLTTFCHDAELRLVPIERIVKGQVSATFLHSIDYWLDAARGLYAGTNSFKEGIVIRPLVETPSLTLGGRLSFKVINNDFLLAEDG